MAAHAISTPTPTVNMTQDTLSQPGSSDADWPFACPTSDYTVAERIDGIRNFALLLQGKMRRITEMARVLQLASETMDPQDERCVRVCAEITQETSEASDDDAEAIERACNVIRRQMAGET